MLMEAKKEIYLLFITIKYNLMREITNDKTFLLNIFFMILNNSIFIIQWLVVFNLKSNIAGYTFKKIMFIWACASASFGLTKTIFSGANSLANLIFTGKLDSFIIQPRNLFLNIITSKSEVASIGDVLYGYILVIILTKDIKKVCIFSILVIMGALILMSFIMAVGSMSFYIKNGKMFASLMNMIMATVSTYPANIFNNFIKVLLFTILPIGYIVYIPANIMGNLNVSSIYFMVIVTIFCIIVSYRIFINGLGKYSSANMLINRF